MGQCLSTNSAIVVEKRNSNPKSLDVPNNDQGSCKLQTGSAGRNRQAALSSFSKSAASSGTSLNDETATPTKLPELSDLQTSTPKTSNVSGHLNTESCKRHRSPSELTDATQPVTPSSLGSPVSLNESLDNHLSIALVMPSIGEEDEDGGSASTQSKNDENSVQNNTFIHDCTLRESATEREDVVKSAAKDYDQLFSTALSLCDQTPLSQSSPRPHLVTSKGSPERALDSFTDARTENETRSLVLTTTIPEEESIVVDEVQNSVITAKNEFFESKSPDVDAALSGSGLSPAPKWLSSSINTKSSDDDAAWTVNTTPSPFMSGFSKSRYAIRPPPSPPRSQSRRRKKVPNRHTASVSSIVHHPYRPADTLGIIRVPENGAEGTDFRWKQSPESVDPLIMSQYNKLQVQIKLAERNEFQRRKSSKREQKAKEARKYEDLLGEFEDMRKAAAANDRKCCGKEQSGNAKMKKYQFALKNVPSWYVNFEAFEQEDEEESYAFLIPSVKPGVKRAKNEEKKRLYGSLITSDATKFGAEASPSNSPKQRLEMSMPLNGIYRNTSKEWDDDDSDENDENDRDKINSNAPLSCGEESDGVVTDDHMANSGGLRRRRNKVKQFVSTPSLTFRHFGKRTCGENGNEGNNGAFSPAPASITSAWSLGDDSTLTNSSTFDTIDSLVGYNYTPLENEKGPQQREEETESLSVGKKVDVSEADGYSQTACNGLQGGNKTLLHRSSCSDSCFSPQSLKLDNDYGPVVRRRRESLDPFRRPSEVPAFNCASHPFEGIKQSDISSFQNSSQRSSMSLSEDSSPSLQNDFVVECTSQRVDLPECPRQTCKIKNSFGLKKKV